MKIPLKKQKLIFRHFDQIMGWMHLNCWQKTLSPNHSTRSILQWWRHWFQQCDMILQWMTYNKVEHNSQSHKNKDNITGITTSWDRTLYLRWMVLCNSTTDFQFNPMEGGIMQHYEGFDFSSRPEAPLSIDWSQQSTLKAFFTL